MIGVKRTLKPTNHHLPLTHPPPAGAPRAFPREPQYLPSIPVPVPYPPLPNLSLLSLPHRSATQGTPAIALCASVKAAHAPACMRRRVTNQRNGPGRFTESLLCLGGEVTDAQ